MIRTMLCDLLGIEYPIIQGGMAWVATAELVAAVSEAGGLGVIGSGAAPPEWLREQLHRTRRLTQKPFGVNVMLLSPYAEEIMEILLKEPVAVVTTGAGNPGKYVTALKELGTRVVPVVSSVALAKRLTRWGVDAFIAEGMESGGHIGELTTMALTPQVVKAVDVPVIAAGGVYDGRGLVAALALGAVGVQMGTRFMCAAECTIPQRVKDFVIRSRDRDTAISGVSTGHPVRALRNKLTRKYEEMEKNHAPVADIENLGVGSLKRAMVEGDIENGTVMAGQVSAMVNKVQPAREIILDIINGARRVVKGLNEQVV
ncbi:MAG: enoyl-[acyl-carrier-protein] reductase FabK [Peptococcaceae bacterium]|nr:enoyl-[acyl-carrier-protein] reductase FabK [Candidatus Syntrophopropionicum ammoniitolerans]